MKPVKNFSLPLVSIITPSYNQGKFIKETIESVLSQDYPKIEYIIIDGGSNDNTQEVLRRYKNISWISEPDRGQAHAINKGFQMAKGDILAWLNSDDLYAPNTLNTVVEYLLEHKETDAVYGMADRIDKNGEVLECWGSGPFTIERLLLSPGPFIPYFIPQPSLFMRRSLLEHLGPLREDLFIALDYEYWLRMARAKSKVDFINKVLSSERVHNLAKTVAFPLKIRSDVLLVRRTFFDSDNNIDTNIARLKNLSLGTAYISLAQGHFQNGNIQNMFWALRQAFFIKPQLFFHPIYLQRMTFRFFHKLIKRIF